MNFMGFGNMTNFNVIAFICIITGIYLIYIKDYSIGGLMIFIAIMLFSKQYKDKKNAKEDDKE
ncbi:MAG: hypothetical protein GXZ08_09960 [Tissierellia bacterium]|nr:hypothetical protein [Tissierellia bacterium]